MNDYTIDKYLVGNRVIFKNRENHAITSDEEYPDKIDEVGEYGKYLEVLLTVLNL